MQKSFVILAALAAACGSSSAPPPPSRPAAATFAVQLPASTSLCGTSSMVVDAVDASGKLASDYRGTVHFTSDDPAAVLPPDYTFTAADAGRRAFTIAMRTPGARKITVTDASNAISATAGALAGGWCAVGPDHPFVPTLAGDPRDGRVVYAGTFGAGVFKTTDAGATWAPASAGLVSQFVSSVVVDPHTPGTIYAATLLGIDKSIDGGSTWFRAFAAAAVKLVADPSAPGTLYAAAAVPATFGGGVLRTTDAGITWSQLNTGIAEADLAMNALAVDPANPSVLYASFPDLAMYITTDAGAHWTPMTPPDAGNQVLALEVDSHSVVFASTNSATWRSRDHGASWSRATAGSSLVGAHVMVDPRSPFAVYAQANFGAQIAKTEDGGATWTFFNLSGASAGAAAIAADPAGGPILLGTFQDGVLKSADGLATTTPANAGLRGAIARGVALAPGSSINVFAVTDGHFDASSDGAATWKESALFGGGALAIDPRTPTTIYTIGPGGSQKSTDAGANWTVINSGAGFGALAIAPDDPSTVYFGTPQGLVKTPDGGQTSITLGPPNTQIWSIAVDGNHPGTLYATTANGAPLKSIDGGQTLTPIAGLPQQSEFVPVVVLSNSAVVIVFKTGAFRSVDQGATWTPGTGLPSVVFPFAMAADAAIPGMIYLVDQAQTIYRSADAGATWTKTLSQLPPQQAISSVAAFNNTLYAAANGMGVLKNLTAGD